MRRVLSLDFDARERILERFRLAGGDLRRWNRSDVRAMADAITRTEDELEATRGMGGGRDQVSINPALVRRLRLRDLRRALEGA